MHYAAFSRHAMGRLHRRVAPASAVTARFAPASMPCDPADEKMAEPMRPRVRGHLQPCSRHHRTGHMADRPIVDETLWRLPWHGRPSSLPPNRMPWSSSPPSISQFLHEQHARHSRWASGELRRTDRRSGVAGHSRTAIPGNAPLSRRLIGEMMQTVDLAICGGVEVRPRVMVPLSFLTPPLRSYRSSREHQLPGPPLAPFASRMDAGEALRRAADLAPERIALVPVPRHFALAGDTGLRKDQRIVGTGICGAGKARPARDVVVYGRGHISRRRPGGSRFALHQQSQRRRKVWAASDIPRHPDFCGGLHRRHHGHW